MSLFSKLFGKGGTGAPPQPEPEAYKGFAITPNPEKTTGGYRIGARIENSLNGAPRQHQMIRADVIASEEEAVSASLRKAKQMIDEQGEALF